jgi:putative Holliday junction resolvase
MAAAHDYALPYRRHAALDRMAMGVVLGFDFGPRKIGIAVGQTITASASPLETIRAKGSKPDWERIGSLIAQWQPEALVVGIPYHIGDREMDWAELIHKFIRQLEGRYRLPVHIADERLTSLEARRQLGRKATSREVIDAMAAKLILETWLSEHD